MTSLFETHKAERRERITSAARKLIAERGYDGLTMRDLARAARVSVPTLYNLFGSKDAIIVAELQAIAGSIAAALPPVGTVGSFFARGMAGFETGMTIIEREPEFFRAAIQMFLTSPATDEVRRRVDNAFIAIMQGNLEAAKRAGQLVEWADPAIVARHMHAHHMATFLAWGLGQGDFATFRDSALSGICHLLAGITCGAFHDEVVGRLRMVQPVLSARLSHQEVPDAKSRSRD
jgi:AcrR family transcriptional regulator